MLLLILLRMPRPGVRCAAAGFRGRRGSRPRSPDGKPQRTANRRARPAVRALRFLPAVRLLRFRRLLQHRRFLPVLRQVRRRVPAIRPGGAEAAAGPVGSCAGFVSRVSWRGRYVFSRRSYENFPQIPGLRLEIDEASCRFMPPEPSYALFAAFRGLLRFLRLRILCGRCAPFMSLRGLLRLFGPLRPGGIGRRRSLPRRAAQPPDHVHGTACAQQDPRLVVAQPCGGERFVGEECRDAGGGREQEESASGICSKCVSLFFRVWVSGCEVRESPPGR